METLLVYLIHWENPLYLFIFIFKLLDFFFFKFKNV